MNKARRENKKLNKQRSETLYRLTWAAAIVGVFSLIGMFVVSWNEQRNEDKRIKQAKIDAVNQSKADALKKEKEEMQALQLRLSSLISFVSSAHLITKDVPDLNAAIHEKLRFIANIQVKQHKLKYGSQLLQLVPVSPEISLFHATHNTNVHTNIESTSHPSFKVSYYKAVYKVLKESDNFDISIASKIAGFNLLDNNQLRPILKFDKVINGDVKGYLVDESQYKIISESYPVIKIPVSFAEKSPSSGQNTFSRVVKFSNQRRKNSVVNQFQAQEINSERSMYFIPSFDDLEESNSLNTVQQDD